MNDRSSSAKIARIWSIVFLVGVVGSVARAANVDTPISEVRGHRCEVCCRASDAVELVDRDDMRGSKGQGPEVVMISGPFLLRGQDLNLRPPGAGRARLELCVDLRFYD